MRRVRGERVPALLAVPPVREVRGRAPCGTETGEPREAAEVGDVTPKEREKLSKKMSYVLRHRPDSVGLVLGEGGWVHVMTLAMALHVPCTDLMEIVEAETDKVRFTISGGPSVIQGWLIRAAQGHSVDVDLKLEAVEPLPVLYHGTHAGALAGIFTDGLRRMERTHVHLSADEATAVKVGTRRGAPVIVVVDAYAAFVRDYKFYLADNGVWLADEVPAEFLTARRPR